MKQGLIFDNRVSSNISSGLHIVLNHINHRTSQATCMTPTVIIGDLPLPEGRHKHEVGIIDNVQLKFHNWQI